jgi:superfamily II DNA/RNA helicase
VHYDPPNEAKDYLHRSGRTARAGASGTVVSFVEQGQSREMSRLLALAQVEASTATVRPGAPEVRVLAESGEPIVVAAMPNRSFAARPPRSGAPSGRPPRSRNPRPHHTGERQAAHHRSSSR